VAKVGTSNPDRTISLKRLQCVVEYNNNVTGCAVTNIAKEFKEILTQQVSYYRKIGSSAPPL